MKHYPDVAMAIQQSKRCLDICGLKVDSKSWQSKKGDYDTLEILNYAFDCPTPAKINLIEQIKPNLPWADVHFDERVSGIPHNPPPSHEIWPFAQKNNKDYMKNEKFDHTYPERFWPKLAGEKEHRNVGITFSYGDLDDVIRLLTNDPCTRQAYLPIWFPEDTGATEGQRVPCTLGYHFIQRSGFLHMTYFIRSCDIIRHFRDDVYLAMKLLHHVCHEAFDKVKPGMFTMHIISLHCFYNERGLLKLEKT